MISNIEMSIDLNYCLTLILYTMIRGIEGESIYSLRDNNFKSNPLTGNLKDYMYMISRLNRGAHHNINDSLDKLIKNNIISQSFKKKIFDGYIDTLKITFGKDGLIHNPQYQIYFKDIFYNKPEGYGYAMQTRAFDFISRTTNKILRENSQ